MAGTAGKIVIGVGGLIVVGGIVYGVKNRKTIARRFDQVKTDIQLNNTMTPEEQDVELATKKDRLAKRVAKIEAAQKAEKAKADADAASKAAEGTGPQVVEPDTAKAAA